MWSGSNTTMCMMYDLTLEATVGGFTGTPTVTASVNGQSVTGQGGWDPQNPYVFFDSWPSLADGSYTVTVTASDNGFSRTATETVIYDCVP